MSGKILEVIDALNKHFGKQVARDAASVPHVRRIPIGVPIVDWIMGGGLAVNRITEFYGPYSSTKSLLAYKAIAKFQTVDWNTLQVGAIKSVKWKSEIVKSKGSEVTVEQTIAVPSKIEAADGVKNPYLKRCVLIDYENTYDKDWGAKQGIDNDGLIHIVPDRGSELVDIVETLLPNTDISLIVIDSIAAASSDLELDASAEDEQMGVNARFWNKAMRKFQAAMNSNEEDDITVIVINRPYAKIGMVFGNPEEVGGGSGLKFGKSVSISLTPLKEIKEKIDGVEQTVGRNIKARCPKNKTARPFLDGEFYISFVDTDTLKAGEIDVISQLVAIGIRNGVIKRSGAFLSYLRKSIQGREKFINYIVENNLQEKLEKDVLYGSEE